MRPIPAWFPSMCGRWRRDENEKRSGRSAVPVPFDRPVRPSPRHGPGRIFPGGAEPVLQPVLRGPAGGVLPGSGLLRGRGRRLRPGGDDHLEPERESGGDQRGGKRGGRPAADVHPGGEGYPDGDLLRRGAGGSHAGGGDRGGGLRLPVPLSHLYGGGI